MKSILILHDIRSSQNVGSLFRTADAAGVDTIYLIGITPTPLDRFGRPNTGLTKASLGAEHTVSWKHFSSIDSILSDLKQEGFYIIAIEQSPVSVDYKSVSLQQKNVFILGNEVEGLPKNILEACDAIAEIPMKGEKESLNVSVAGGIALFRILNV
jgi:23S rRNA (guanosine2251-2'-O)-methyltransferase